MSNVLSVQMLGKSTPQLSSFTVVILKVKVQNLASITIMEHEVAVKAEEQAVLSTTVGKCGPSSVEWERSYLGYLLPLIFLVSFLFSLPASSFCVTLFSHSLYQDNLGFSYGSAPRSDIGELIARMVKNLENAQMTHSTVDYQGTDERPAWVRMFPEADCFMGLLFTDRTVRETYHLCF